MARNTLSSNPFTYQQHHAVLEVGEFAVALFTTIQSVLLVYHFLIAILRGTCLVHAVLLAQMYDCAHTAKIICLGEQVCTISLQILNVFQF